MAPDKLVIILTLYPTKVKTNKPDNIMCLTIDKIKKLVYKY